MSYGDIAKRIGRPKAVRAVGAANGRNPIPIVVPCHRVIGSDGDLDRYLRQRNAAIRIGRADAVIPWDRPFAEAALRVDSLRRGVLGQLEPAIRGLLSQWKVGFEVRFRYRQGWRDETTTLEEQLREKLDSDLRQGFTGRAPSRLGNQGRR